MSISGNWDRRLSRRSFLGMGGLSAAALVLGSKEAAAKSAHSAGYGELVADPGGIISLPRGFQYRIISEQGTTISNGAPVPGDHDGMAAFKGEGDTTVLVRNHELRPSDMAGGDAPVSGKNPYDPAAPGGTTAIVVDNETRKEIRDYVTSSGTLNNCAGGATPWGTWITCEEDRTTGHGYAFEVDPGDPENDLSKTPIRGMGFFSHEAVDIDPNTGIAYLTEDDFRGSIPADPNAEVVADLSTSEGGTGTRVSFLYRYVPNVKAAKPGDLQKGGKLQVMTLREKPNYNVDLANPGQEFGVVWEDVNPEEPHEDAEAKGGARFNRLEGAYFAGGAFWFDDTAGGEKRLGQVFRYLPSTNTLELFYEGTDANKMESPDNIVVTPWGDLWFAEDGEGENRVMGITPDGEVYKFASNTLSEFAGPTFSPDGKTFFVNIQNPGITFAIWGPFKRRNAGRQRQMSVAAPPALLAPRVSGELAEAAEKFGMSSLEAAAYDRLGVSLV
ncbi:MAG TPA: alkaline phosphatase PhoX [Rubrobacteraceae bacterium]|nr:alkaline phosphatase PhoX [Rubrobacteraceae bacterium]